MVEPTAFIDEKIAEIADDVGDANAVIALSGGVDSSTAAALAYEAIGDQLTPVYVDTGLMRKGETDQIRDTFDYMDSLRIIDARDRFLDALSGITDPEEKRHAIGEQFIREFETVARDVDADYLVQGTIYPDRIESEGTIKSHHNVGGLPEVVDFEGIVEPMRDLYKDEVREVARELDLESIIAERMPFPGPGLAIRVLGEVTDEKLAVAREANHVVEEELEEYEPWQALAAVLGKATGVKGDNRVHGWVVSVRSVESRDGMTARAQELDWETLQRIQSRITGENENVARVVYDVTHKPPATIEYE
ncbi:GMP synthase (glutamine-hydrolyzing) subunit B [Natronomonas pharaonis DSM 2160]|uniref:GMP synthase [glutamine-hydrolyzing] subunit B n=1 Tax=Natronomonas pharaonis (strain ATCC 35678 / DSM 2160 / CIP 103997 / JCM 8858 / NBRC 14720 / NCIMB 2260 / Gabara) TaxID=348780 RepID=GUAAB_NATPD|nr:glutamine-hydrolyzing GMP synthase [Natronomonas pharaonis]Q3IS14.1 RecName: Full=GMP synthase [glutamine-hydrolyzing] subunit B; AltName: Full=GMP synthetase [Natronomonas pharaonis DSM 2160]CAI49076.1 GMP synthase (glutamine-hydrolyzing) subunit B [Natronomonas pharaonis DSM 2160]